MDNAVREEREETTKWANRKERVAALVAKYAPDIVCFQELRDLPNNERAIQYLASSRFGSYRFEMAFRNPSPLPFAQAILWNPAKFFALQTVRQWISSTPNEVSDSVTSGKGAQTSPGYLLLGVQFQFVHQNKIVRDVDGNSHPFWIFTTHLGMEEDCKTASCKLLGDIIRQRILVGDRVGQPFVLAGDLNLFPDRDADLQRRILREEHGMFDLGQQRMVSSQTGRDVGGTFVGFEHDAFRAPDMSNLTSRLDHVWTSDERVQLLEPLLVLTESMLEPEPAELTTRNLPSDHLPLLAKLELQV